MNKPDIEIIMPIYNESGSMQDVIARLFTELRKKKLPLRFILCEDGSTDATKKILRSIQRSVPATVITRRVRGGYSAALRTGMEKTTAQFVLCVDSDGQYNPKDFWKLWRLIAHCDIAVGRRKRRADPFSRRFISRLFYMFFRYLFPENIHDPSCSFVLIRRGALKAIVPQLGLTNEGFWWEFMARARQHGFVVREHDVDHRARQSGDTKVYPLKSLPRIAYTHIIAMIHIGLSRLGKG